MPFLTSTNPVVTVSGSDPITSTEGSTPIISIQDATIDQKGAVQLEDSLTSTSVTKAATPKSVKESYEYTTTLSGNLQIDIDGKSDVGHIHDDRYYTETEVDNLHTTLSGNLSDEIDSDIVTFSGTINHDTIINTHNLTIDIDHNQLKNFSVDEHRLINDSAFGVTDLWSAQKIDNELDDITTISGVLDDHNHFDNLDGGTDGEYYHLTENEHTMLTSGIECTIHKHDDRYYTELEIDTISGSLSNEIDSDISTHSSSGDHDWRYYTETEINTISGTLQTDIDSKSDVGHDHTEDDITNLDKYTQMEVNTISGSLSTEIDSDISTHNSDTTSVHGITDTSDLALKSGNVNQFSDITSSGTDIEDAVTKKHTESHNIASHSDTTATGAELNELTGSGDTSLHKHDDRYYTESETDTISGSLNTKIDGKVSDTSYASSWDWITTIAPSKNAVYDEMQLQPKATLTAQGDILYASAPNVLARLAKGTANKKLFMNAAGTIPEWAAGVKVGSFVHDTATATGTQAVTGVGFKPSAVIFIAAINVTSEVSVGLDDGTTKGCITNYYTVTANTWAHSTVSIFLQQASGVTYTGSISAFGADGFTISWTKTGAKTGSVSVYYLAFR